MKQEKATGKVYLIGAGPGDPELLTLKALRYLRKADIILADRLVSDCILTQYIRPHTEVLHVGKQNGRGGSTPQGTINELLVHYAKQGKIVARLKGGDVSFFSNILDELRTLTDHHIPYEIVPGITAASGAAAYAGIPLTARNYSTAVRFLTCYSNDILTDAYWNELALTTDTLVFYMSSETLPVIVSNLLNNQADPGRRLAVIEQATTPFQTVYTSSLKEFHENRMVRKFKSPSIVIIGKVVELHDQFAWLSNGDHPVSYFEPLTETLEIAQDSKRA